MIKKFLKIAHLFRRFYWRLVRPETRGVRAILVNNEGKILLVWHTYQEGWFLPGGKISKEESDEDALRRELQEELGVESMSGLEKLGEYTNTHEYKKDTISVFIVSDFVQKTKSHFEIEEKQFFDPQNLPKGVSTGTKKRIEEWLGQRTKTNHW